MDGIKTIKHLRSNRDQSIDQIRKAMNINWRTAKKYTDSDQLFITDPTRESKSMMDDSWEEIIGSWLEEDLCLRRKLRRTAKAIHGQLKPLGFPGSYRTVCVYISQWKEQRYSEANYQAVDRLDHPIGEVQVSFGTMEVMYEDHMKDIQLLVMSSPHGSATSASAMPAQNQEYFLEALEQLFNQRGSVLKTIRIDNLTPTMKKTKSKFKEVQLTDEFLHFAIHYSYDVQVCDPCSGHEKGHVENKVGYIRYSFFSTSPIMDSSESLNKQFGEQSEADRKRTHYSKHQLIEDLWKKENKALHSLPQENYPTFREVGTKLNRYRGMKLDQTVIHIPKAYDYSQLAVVLTWNEFKILTSHGEILMNEYRPYMNKKRLIP